MRRYLIGVLKGALIISTSLAMAQDAGRRSPPPTTRTTGGTGMGGQDNTAAVHGEGEIVATMAAADRGEVSQGTYAQSHASRPEVRDFARSMVTMHTDASARMATLARRLGITPAECDESRRVTADGEAAQRRLSGLSGAAFDRAYLDAQIAAHSHVLELLDRALLPAARTPDLRTALQDDARPMVAGHLARARALRAHL